VEQKRTEGTQKRTQKWKRGTCHKQELNANSTETEQKKNREEAERFPKQEQNFYVEIT